MKNVKTNEFKNELTKDQFNSLVTSIRREIKENETQKHYLKSIVIESFINIFVSDIYDTYATEDCETSNKVIFTYDSFIDFVQCLEKMLNNALTDCDFIKIDL